MHKFCILFVPNTNCDFIWRAPSRAWDAESTNYKLAQDNNSSEFLEGVPIILKFQRERDRDALLDDLCKQFPKRQFAAIDVKYISEGLAGPVKKYSLDERGMLPV